MVTADGQASNGKPFTVADPPNISGVSPETGAGSVSVTFTGTGFGATQGTGTVWLGSTNGNVVSWSETEVVATVASTALTGIARIQQNGVWSNALAFTVPGANAVTLVPNLLNLVVGETHTIQALNSAGQPVTGLTWTSSNPNVVSLWSADPPVLTALAAGHVTVTADTASADGTVHADALPQGKVLWSNPGASGSPVLRIVPAVPSSEGVADVFAFHEDGTVDAITSEGITAWTADVSQGFYWYPGYILPDFRGGLVFHKWDDNCGNCSVVRLDGATGQAITLHTRPPNADWHYARLCCWRNAKEGRPLVLLSDGRSRL